MHTVRGLVRGFAAFALVAGWCVGDATPAAPVQEDDEVQPCDRCPHNGTTTDSGFSAAASAYVSVMGGESSDVDAPCGPSYWTDSYVIVRSDPMSDGRYRVLVLCSTRHNTDPLGAAILGDYIVTPQPPEDLIAQAIAGLDIPRPVVRTEPGGGDPSLVGIETWFDLEGGAAPNVPPYTVTGADGLLAVRVTAVPDADAEVTWDTGEATFPCPYDPPASDPGDHTYLRSSLGQPGSDENGRPAYSITASVTYQGSYQVFLAGQAIGPSVPIGALGVTSDPYLLAVQEAQALNSP